MKDCMVWVDSWAPTFRTLIVTPSPGLSEDEGRSGGGHGANVEVSRLAGHGDVLVVLC